MGESTFIYKVVADYINGDGAQVQHRRQVAGERPGGWTDWCSFAMLLVQTPAGPITRRFEIPLVGARDAKTAFAAIPDNVEAAKEQAIAEVRDEAVAMAREESGALWTPGKEPPPGAGPEPPVLRIPPKP